MKKLLFIVTLLTSTINFAQNQGFNYKALITQNGNVLNTQSVNFRFTLMENGTTAVYQETQNATTDNNGIVSVNVGEGTVISGDFSTIDWGNNSYFLKVEVDTGNGYQDFGTSELKYVPYAKYAEKAGNTFSGNYDDLTNKPDFTGWDTNASDDFSGNFNDLTNVPAGLSDGDDDTHLSDSDIAAMGYIKNPDDADHDATNELQNLSLNGNQLSISNGNNVSFNGWDIDASDDFSGNYNDLTNIPQVWLVSNGSNSIPATSITDEIYHLGAVGIGAVSSNSMLNVRNQGTSSGADFLNTSRFEMAYLGNSNATSLYNDVSGNNGFLYGNYNNIHSNDNAQLCGIGNNIFGTTTGDIIGVNNVIRASGNGTKYGILTNFVNSDGRQIGVSNLIGGTQNDNQYGMATYISNSGNGIHFGVYNSLSSNGDGEHYGSYNEMSVGNGQVYGTYNILDSDGNATGFGTFNKITNWGNGKKYGTYNYITPLSEGPAIGTYNRIESESNEILIGSVNSLDINGHATLYHDVYGHIDSLNVANKARIIGHKVWINTTNSTAIETGGMYELKGVSNFKTGNKIDVFGGYSGSYSTGITVNMHNGLANDNSLTAASFYVDDQNVGNAIAVYAYAGNSPNSFAGFFNGKVKVNGNVIVNEKLKGSNSGDADMKAFVYGLVFYNGNIAANQSSDGFSVTKISQGVYRIHLDNVNDQSYVVMVSSEIGGAGTPVFATTDYSNTNGEFIIRTYNLSGNTIDNSFHFVVYKK